MPKFKLPHTRSTPRPVGWAPFQRVTDLVGGNGISHTVEWPVRYFQNNLYGVYYRPVPPDATPSLSVESRPPRDGERLSTWLVHLSIKRLDRQPIHDWRHLQRIKNELCGTDREAVEIYPAEDRKVDAANQFHLWVLPPGGRVGLGAMSRDIGEPREGAALGSVQRPFASDDPYNAEEAFVTREGVAGGWAERQDLLDAVDEAAQALGTPDGESDAFEMRLQRFRRAQEALLDFIRAYG